MLKHESHENVPSCIEAACMEIPQRVMMQTFVLGILSMQKLNTIWSVFITALMMSYELQGMQEGYTENTKASGRI